MGKSWFRLKAALSYESMGAPKDRKKGEKLSLYRFSGKTPVLVLNPVDQTYFRGREELLIECAEDGTPIISGKHPQDQGAAFAGRAISFQRYKLAPKFGDQGPVSANTPNAPIPKQTVTNGQLPNLLRVDSGGNTTPNVKKSTTENVEKTSSTKTTKKSVAKKSSGKKTTSKKTTKPKKHKCRGCGKGYSSRSGRLYHEVRCDEAKTLATPSNA